MIRIPIQFDPNYAILSLCKKTLTYSNPNEVAAEKRYEEFKKIFFMSSIKQVIEELPNYIPEGVDKDKIAEEIAKGLLKKIEEAEESDIQQ
jgi:alpha-mannosidase